MSARIADLLSRLDDVIPFAWAEPWDRVGLLSGHDEAPLTKVFVSLDPTQCALERARESGASVLLTHHPAFLAGFDRLVPSGRDADVALAALEMGIALIACHTNLDRAPAGAEALPAALGLESLGPLERGGREVARVVVFAPVAAAELVRRAMADAGAGRVGEYEACSFEARGVGRFTPRTGAAPASGLAEREETADEVRIEVVCPAALESAVIAAAREVHPYEEPVVLSSRETLSLGAARMGRLCRAPAASDLRSLADIVGERLKVRCTVWGDGARPVSAIACAQGSGRSLVSDALAAGADTFVTGEMRYHEALEALHAGLAVIEAGHDATEWPLVPVLADAARATAGLAGDSVIVDTAEYEWWTD